MKKIGITLIAGLALTVTGPAISAQAGPTRWTLVHAEATASFYACRIPLSNGTTIRAYLDGDLVGVGAGIAVLNSAVVAEVALDGAAPAGDGERWGHHWWVRHPVASRHRPRPLLSSGPSTRE